MNFSLLKRCNISMTVAFHHSHLISSCAQAALRFGLGIKAGGCFPKIMCCINAASLGLRDSGARAGGGVGAGVTFLSTLSDTNASLVDLPPGN